MFVIAAISVVDVIIKNIGSVPVSLCLANSRIDAGSPPVSKFSLGFIIMHIPEYDCANSSRVILTLPLDGSFIDT